MRHLRVIGRLATSRDKRSDILIRVADRGTAGPSHALCRNSHHKRAHIRIIAILVLLFQEACRGYYLLLVAIHRFLMMPLRVRAGWSITILALASASAKRVNHRFPFIFLMMGKLWLVCELSLLLLASHFILPDKFISMDLQLACIIVKLLESRALLRLRANDAQRALTKLWLSLVASLLSLVVTSLLVLPLLIGLFLDSFRVVTKDEAVNRSASLLRSSCLVNGS